VSALSELRERVEKAGGPSRELDARIWHALNPDQDIVLDQGKAFGPGPKRAALRGPLRSFPIDGWEDWDSVAIHIGAPLLTASIDAALTLVDRKLPGWGWEVRTSNHRLGFTSLLFDTKRQQFGDGRSAPLAILSALLRALESQEKDGG
jgi:hypothetical protein